ncbi:MAG TPA: hypothetical protein ENG87_02735, partial [Candidatus Pacearchaeota archaeon]|nr:hypothetical protein [Candidatus Pacearchaeota archaeon]
MKIKDLTKTMGTKKILIAEAVFVFGIMIYVFIALSPNQIYPLHGMTISEPDFVFEIENGEQVILSFDKDFTDPIILEEDSDIILPPGTYYWKVKSRFRESEVMNFTIQSHVGLEVKERGENYEIKNSGNVDLNVTKESQGITGEFTLEVGSSEETEKKDS